MSSFSQNQWPSWAYTEVNDPYTTYSQYSGYPSYLADSMEAYQAHHQHLIHHQMSRATESKPRLSKEEVEVLEAEFLKNHKPNSTTKKALAEQMRVDNARINNWFQNRRAREKKERNIRDYEARQKLEKDRSDPEGSTRPHLERRHELVASSAPFPGSSSPKAFRTNSCSSCGSRERLSDGSDTTETSCPDCITDSPTPESTTQSFAVDNMDRQEDNGLPGLHSDSLMGGPRGFHDSFAHRSMQASENGFRADGLLNPNIHRSPSNDESQLQSPASIDIASRRNRRPPTLAINANFSRSHSAGFLRAGIDLGRRSEVGSSMRRVASATGPMRVTKSTAPRSPFNMSRSPVLAGSKGSAAPPTPDTPILANQPANTKIEAPLQTAFNLHHKLSAHDMALHNATVHTPPTTPGIAEGFFNINAAYDHVSDRTIMTPMFANFQGDFRVPSTSVTVPSYVTGDDSSSQPGTPSHASHIMGPTYFGGVGGSTEYNWSDGSVSGSSSPGPNPNVHFMNMTPSSFVAVDR